MSALVAFVVGAVVAALLWRAMSDQLRAADVLRRTNYRGHEVVVASGIVVVLAVVVVAAAHRVLVAFGGVNPDEQLRVAGLAVATTVGFGFLGLVDDLVGTVDTKGFAGHLGALVRGQVTTGLVKLVGGVLLGVVVAPGTGWDAVRSGVLIAACANVGNLFDRAPGRTIKVCLLGGLVVAAIGGPAWALTGPMLVLGAGLGMLVADLSEQCMLGDTGSNVLGAALGVGLAVSLGAPAEWIALAVVVALNVASEFVSFTKVIDAVAPLRFVDRLGARPERRAR